MSLVRVRRAAQLTLPTDVRRALNVKEGDYLEAQVRKDGVLLKPVAMVGRAEALARIRKVVARVRPKSDGMSEESIVREVKRRRQKHA
jgi:AbrB family looped-hinge helix DNA binding protein